MTRTVFAALLLSLSVAACDSSPTETNSNATSPTKAKAGDYQVKLSRVTDGIEEGVATYYFRVQ